MAMVWTCENVGQEGLELVGLSIVLLEHGHVLAGVLDADEEGGTLLRRNLLGLHELPGDDLHRLEMLLTVLEVGVGLIHRQRRTLTEGHVLQEGGARRCCGLLWAPREKPLGDSLRAEVVGDVLFQPVQVEVLDSSGQYR